MPTDAKNATPLQCPANRGGDRLQCLGSTYCSSTDYGGDKWPGKLGNKVYAALLSTLNIAEITSGMQTVSPLEETRLA